MGVFEDIGLAMAAAVENQHMMYLIENATLGQAVKLLGVLDFPDFPQILSAETATREIAPEDIEFISMDEIAFAAGGFGATMASTKAAGAYSFEETDADFAVLMI